MKSSRALDIRIRVLGIAIVALYGCTSESGEIFSFNNLVDISVLIVTGLAAYFAYQAFKVAEDTNTREGRSAAFCRIAGAICVHGGKHSIQTHIVNQKADAVTMKVEVVIYRPDGSTIKSKNDTYYTGRELTFFPMENDFYGQLVLEDCFDVTEISKMIADLADEEPGYKIVVETTAWPITSERPRTRLSSKESVAIVLKREYGIDGFNVIPYK